MDLQGRYISVQIDSGNEPVTSDNTVVIGEPSFGLFFTKDAPIETTHAYNDQFDIIMRESCTIRLLASEPLTHLYSQDVLDNKVTVTRSGEVIFMGYVEPQAFSQPFNSRYDEVELSCIDLFSALQYRVWGDVSRADVDYDTAKAGATRMTFGAVLKKCTDAVGADLQTITDGTIKVGTLDAMSDIEIDTTVFSGMTKKAHGRYWRWPRAYCNILTCVCACTRALSRFIIPTPWAPVTRWR